MPAATFVEYNVLFRNKRATIAGDVERLARPGRVLCLNEVSKGDTPPGRGVDDAVGKLGWEQWHEESGDNRILWDPAVWASDGFRGNRQVGPSAKEWGIDAANNPPRWLLWQGLTHIESGTRHLFYCTHVTAGYAKPEGAWSDRLEDYKDDSAMHHMLWVVSLVARHMLTQRHYTFHHLLGDLNSQQHNEAVWWYPARVLDGLFVPDTQPRSIDWMLHSHQSAAKGLKVKRRWSLGAKDGLHSDHRAQLKAVTW